MGITESLPRAAHICDSNTPADVGIWWTRLENTSLKQEQVREGQNNNSRLMHICHLLDKEGETNIPFFHEHWVHQECSA